MCVALCGYDEGVHMGLLHRMIQPDSVSLRAHSRNCRPTLVLSRMGGSPIFMENDTTVVSARCGVLSLCFKAMYKHGGDHGVQEHWWI